MKQTTPHITISNLSPKHGDTITVTTYNVPNSMLKKGSFLCAIYIYQGQAVMATEVAGAMIKNKDGSVTSQPILLGGPGVDPAGGPSPRQNLPGYISGAATAVAATYTDKGGVHDMAAQFSFAIQA